MRSAKKRQARKALRGALFFLAVFSAFPGSAAESARNTELDAAVFGELVQKGRLDRTSYKKNLDPVLCPDTELGRHLREGWISDEEPIFIAESLFYLKKADGDSENEIPLISRLMRRFSTMQGIEYYSNSSGKTETLYSQSHTIADAESMRRIPDRTDEPADNLTLYLYQEDNSFGETVYEGNIRQRENEVALVLHNVKPVKFSFITAVKKSNLTMSFLFIDKGDYILTYIFAQLKFPALSIFEEKVNESFRARIDAIYDWFEASYFEAKQEENK